MTNMAIENLGSPLSPVTLAVVELRVLSGLHQGAILPLFGDQWTLGAQGEHDLTLMDPELSGSHFDLQRDHDGWLLHCHASLITDAEGHQSAQARLELNQPFALGNVWLCLAPAGDRSPAIPQKIAAVEPLVAAVIPRAEPRSRPSYGKRLALAGLVVTIASSAWAFTRPASDYSRLIAPKVVPAIDPGAARLSARKQLQHMLSDRLLDADVSISDSENGNVLVLKGALKGDAFALYQRMLERARLQLPAGVVLTDEVNVFQTHLPFVIVQILNGPQAHIVIADGSRMFVGDERDGVKLVSIDDKTIEFDGAQHYKVTW